MWYGFANVFKLYWSRTFLLLSCRNSKLRRCLSVYTSSFAASSNYVDCIQSTIDNSNMAVWPTIGPKREIPHYEYKISQFWVPTRDATAGLSNCFNFVPFVSVRVGCCTSFRHFEVIQNAFGTTLITAIAFTACTFFLVGYRQWHPFTSVSAQEYAQSRICSLSQCIYKFSTSNEHFKKVRRNWKVLVNRGNIMRVMKNYGTIECRVATTDYFFRQGYVHWLAMSASLEQKVNSTLERLATQ